MQGLILFSAEYSCGLAHYVFDSHASENVFLTVCHQGSIVVVRVLSV